MSSEKIVLIIQSRNGSRRFPNKAIVDLCGSPLLERIIQRVKKSKMIDKIILATTKKKRDKVLIDIAKRNKISFFRGSENDLVDRFYQAVKKKNYKHILRLPADNPLPQPEEFDKLIKYHLVAGKDFSSNLCNFFNNGYPDGIGVEIFTKKSLEKIWHKEKRKRFREHISLNYYDYKKKRMNNKFKFSVGTIKCPKIFSRPNLILDVNYKKDYLFIKKIYEYFFNKNKYFHIKDVVRWYDNVYKKN